MIFGWGAVIQKFRSHDHTISCDRSQLSIHVCARAWRERASEQDAVAPFAVVSKSWLTTAELHDTGVATRDGDARACVCVSG